MTKLELLKNLRELQKVEDAYFDSLPRDISMAFIENGYTEALYKANALLMQEAFGDLAEEVGWFMYEWKPGYSLVEADGTEWTFEDDEAYYKHFERLCE